MASRRPIDGEMTEGRSPNRRPLQTLAPEHLDDFMWMFEVELEDGTRLHAYKHYWTRDYIHPAEAGRAFYFTRRGQYRETDGAGQLDVVLRRDRPGPPPLDSVRQNLWLGRIELEWAPSATKHRISRRRATHVIETTDLHLLQYPSSEQQPGGATARLLFVGGDPAGVPLEVIAVEMDRDPEPRGEFEEIEFPLESRLHVIHAMRLRKRYRKLYEEAERCRR